MHTTRDLLPALLLAALTLLACENGLIHDPATPPLPAEDPDPAPEQPVAYDYIGGSFDKFNVGDTRWDRSDLTWCLASTTPDLPRQEQLDAITAAWNEWQRVSNLTFRRVDRCDSADFTVGFAAGDHGDGDPFDAAGGVLAHAFFPQNGRIHFDEAETWTTATRPHGGGDKDLQTVALHEIGHALGLRHSDTKGAVMFAFYGGSLRTLQSDDVLGIQSIYRAVDPSRDDHGDTLASATPTALGRTLDGAINRPGDLDVLTFDLNAPGAVTLGSAGSTDTVCALLDASGARLAENDDTPTSRNCRIDANLTRAGRYYVSIRHYDPSRTGPYAFTLAGPPNQPEPEPPEEPQTPPCPAGEACNPIVARTFPFTDSRDTRTATSDAFDRYSCAPSTHEADNEVLYAVDVPSNGRLTASVNDVRGDGIDIDVHLLRALDPDTCIVRDNARFTAQVRPGRYFVSVDTWVNASGTPLAGPYTLTLTFLPDNASLTADHADTFEEASPIGEDATTQANIDAPGDNDLFQLTPSLNAPYALLTEGATPTACQLYDDARRLLADSADGCALRANLTAGQTYTLRVRHADPEGTGSYTLVTFPDLGDPNADDADADGVPDAQDRCANTPRGERVWSTPEWAGCAPGQTRD